MQKLTLQDIDPAGDEVLPAVMKLYADACENLLNESDVKKERASHSLYYAVCSNRADLVEKVLEKFSSQIDLSIMLNGQSLLGIAAAAEAAEIIGLLLAAGADIQQINTPGHYPIRGAVLKNHWDFVEKILVHAESHADPVTALGLYERDAGGNTIAHHAAAQGRQDTLQKLVSIGVDIGEPNHTEESPMFTAARNGHWDLTISELRAHSIRKGGVDLLIENAPNRNGETLLILAACQNKIDVIQLMLADGVKNINQSDYQGFTALLTAANRGHWHVVNRILEHGRSIGDPLESLQLNHANDYGYTLAHYAAKEGSVEVLQFLQDAGADLNLRALDGHSPLSLAIESKGAEIAASYLESLGYTVEPEQPNEIQSRKGLALLFLAVVTNKNNLVKKILDQKTDNINQFTGLGFTALQLAASYCHWGMVNTILEHVRSLDNPRISLQLNHKNDYGYTLAHYAAEYGNIELLRYLKAAGADLNVKANDGFTPLSLASYYNHDDISRDIFDVPDQAEEESVSNQSENHTHTNAMLQSLATHFLGVSPGSKTRFVEFTTPEENDAPESGSTELPIHNKKKST